MRIVNRTRFILSALVIILLIAGVFSGFGLLIKSAVNYFKQSQLNQYNPSGMQNQNENLDEQEAYVKNTITIDAGHGGFDNGTTSEFSGVQEQDLNLEIAEKLKIRFEANGYKVAMTREDNQAVSDNKQEDMDERREMIAGNTEGVSISIHMNSYDKDSNISGPEVYYYPGQSEGKALATAILTSMNETLNPSKKRTIVEYEFYILSKAETAAVLVECGFLTNKSEELLLRDSSYQDRLTLSIYEGTVQYLEQRLLPIE
jgi:N-acetylmuramoyl-L-alanine amidase